MTHHLGARDLVTAAANAMGSARAHADKGSYERRRYELLREQLGVQFDLLDGDREPFGARPASLAGLPDLLRSTVERLARLRPNPFDGYLEAPAAVVEAYGRHNSEIGAATEALHRTLVDLAVDLLGRLEPGVAGRTTTHQALQAAGLPDPVDPWDNF